MAAPAYSSLLFAYRGLSFTQSLPGPPPGSIYVVRDIDAYGNMDPFSTARLYVRGSLNETFAFLDWPSNSESWQGWRGRQVIGQASPWSVSVLGGGSIDLRISGYVLSA